MRQFINIVEDSQNNWFNVTIAARYHVLDGYHRVVKAHRHGNTQVLVQEVV